MRTVADTSLRAWLDLQPILPECQEDVYGVFWTRPGKPDWTGREIAEVLGWHANCVSPRLNELEEMGLLEFSRKRHCSITQRRVQAWRLATRIRAR